MVFSKFLGPIDHSGFPCGIGRYSQMNLGPERQSILLDSPSQLECDRASRRPLARAGTRSDTPSRPAARPAPRSAPLAACHPRTALPAFAQRLPLRHRRRSATSGRCSQTALATALAAPYKNFKGPFSARGRVRDGPVGCQVREPSVQDRGFFRHRSKAPDPGRFGLSRECRAKGAVGWELNRMGGGFAAGIRCYVGPVRLPFRRID